MEGLTTTELLTAFAAVNSPFYIVMIYLLTQSSKMNERLSKMNERLSRIEGALFPPTILSERPKEEEGRFRDPSLVRGH